MRKQFVVKSFLKENMKPVSQSSFNNINQCKNWCSYHYLINLENMNFEIHQYPKQISYIKGNGSRFLTIRWFNSGYPQILNRS